MKGVVGRHSIKRRLIASVLLVEVASTICICALALGYEHRTRFHAFEQMLRGRADSLLGAVQDAENAQDDVMLDGTESRLPKADIFEVWDQNFRVVGKSTNWEGLDPRTLPGEAHKSEPMRINGKLYRAIQISGMRMVDPGDRGGGTPRPVLIIYGSPVEPVWQEVWEAVEFYALTSIALLVVSGLLMLWLLNRGLAPLGELAQQASRVSVASWDFEPSGRTRSTLELAPLATALETVLLGLKQSFEQQRRFVSDAAHELKTGVAVVKSSMQVLAMKPRSALEYQAGLERCERDCERLEEIVAGMLTLARVEGGGASTVVSGAQPQTELPLAIDAVASQLALIAEVNGVTIAIQPLPTANALKVPLEDSEAALLFSNILLNALQHSVSGSVVEVQTECWGGMVEIRVIDRGEGIEPELVPFVFERFFRSDPSRSRRTGGTGLGLAISKAIVDQHGGTIAIESRLGVGTTVIVRLPFVVEPTKEAVASPLSSSILSK